MSECRESKYLRSMRERENLSSMSEWEYLSECEYLSSMSECSESDDTWGLLHLLAPSSTSSSNFTHLERSSSIKILQKCKQCIECTGGLRVSVNKPLFWHCGVKNVANSQLWYEDTQSFQNLHYRKLALEGLDFPFWKFNILYFLIPKFLHYFERGIFLNRSEFWPLCTVIWTNSMILFNFIVWTSSTIWYPTQYTDHHLIWEQQSCSYKQHTNRIVV